jgi:predicted SAM-dependent methyltransferase
MKKEYIEQAERSWWDNSDVHRSDIYFSRMYKGAIFDIKEPVLSIGEGKGYFLNWLNIKKAAIMDVCEPSKKFNYEFIKKDLNESIKTDRRYKTIFIMEVLEHLIKPMNLMRQVYDLLDNDGICYVSIPYTKINPDSEDILSHKHRWKDYEIKQQIEELGFNVKFVLKRRRFKNTAFFLPHCFLVLKLTKRFI